MREERATTGVLSRARLMHSSRASVDAVRVGIDFVSHSLPGSTRLCFIGRCSR